MIDSTLKNANVLIVDDQEANIDLLEGLLEMQGYENLKTTTDPRDVVQLFASFKPDLILLDLSMPYLSGFEVMEQLKSLTPANTFLPVLVLTADATPESKQRALTVGAHDFLTKPFDLIEVGLRIKNLLLTSYLQQQLRNKNQILEERVKDRIRELERTNIELIAAKDKAEASDRLKTAFMQNISHEIRTPLNGILGFGAMLTDPDITNEERREYSELLQTSSYRLMNTITDYMDISLIVSGNMDVNVKTVNVMEILKEFEDEFQGSCEARNLTFNLQIPDNQGELSIETDPELIRKMVSHIMGNAIKFTYQGGITFGYSVRADSLEFFVKDTGIGIDEEAQQRIFDSFMQENVSNTRIHEGSGLGLTIANKIAEMMGGRIWLESVKGKGSTFYFTIPLAPSLINS